MPTRLRSLYTGVDRDPGGRKFLKSIDRDLELALREFGPGAKRMKDKQIFVCDGFSPAIRVSRIGGREELEADGRALERRETITFCPLCQYMSASAGHAEVAESCPECGNTKNSTTVAPELQFRTYESWVPNGFRVQSSRPSLAGEEDRHGTSSRTFLAVSLGDRVTFERVLNSSLTTGLDERLYCINDRMGKLFFTDSLDGQRDRIAGDSNGWVGGQIRAESNTMGNIAFAIHASKRTDVLRIRHDEVPPGLDLDPRRSGGAVRVAFASAGELIRRAWALELDISPEEIEVLSPAAIPGMSDPTRWQGPLTLADDHPNGAGYVAELRNRWCDLLNRFTHAEHPLAFVQTLTDKSKHGNCSRACYICLRSYQNRFIDPLLDWRLGLDLIRTLQDASYLCGLLNIVAPEGAAQDSHDWIAEARRSVDALCHAFPEECTQPNLLTSSRLPAFRVSEGDSSRIVLVRHPLWADRSSVEGNALDAAFVEADDITASLPPDIVDCFNLRHRPSWTRQRLLARLRGVNGA